MKPNSGSHASASASTGRSTGEETSPKEQAAIQCIVVPQRRPQIQTEKLPRTKKLEPMEASPAGANPVILARTPARKLLRIGQIWAPCASIYTLAHDKQGRPPTGES